jgi:hypothetical protein
MDLAASAPATKKMLWASYIISALPAVALIFSAVMKLIKPAELVTEFERLGYAENLALAIGIVEFVCTIIYVIPQTAVLGAILLTGYLGGAVATHVRVGDGVSGFASPAIVGVLVWLGLYLRDPRLRALVPLRR